MWVHGNPVNRFFAALQTPYSDKVVLKIDVMGIHQLEKLDAPDSGGCVGNCHASDVNVIDLRYEVLELILVQKPWVWLAAWYFFYPGQWVSFEVFPIHSLVQDASGMPDVVV